MKCSRLLFAFTALSLLASPPAHAQNRSNRIPTIDVSIRYTTDSSPEFYRERTDEKTGQLIREGSEPRMVRAITEAINDLAAEGIRLPIFNLDGSLSKTEYAVRHWNIEEKSGIWASDKPEDYQILDRLMGKVPMQADEVLMGQIDRNNTWVDAEGKTHARADFGVSGGVYFSGLHLFISKKETQLESKTWNITAGPDAATQPAVDVTWPVAVKGSSDGVFRIATMPGSVFERELHRGFDGNPNVEIIAPKLPMTELLEKGFEGKPVHAYYTFGANVVVPENSPTKITNVTENLETASKSTDMRETSGSAPFMQKSVEGKRKRTEWMVGLAQIMFNDRYKHEWAQIAYEEFGIVKWPKGLNRDLLQIYNILAHKKGIPLVSEKDVIQRMEEFTRKMDDIRRSEKHGGAAACSKGSGAN